MLRHQYHYHIYTNSSGDKDFEVANKIIYAPKLFSRVLVLKSGEIRYRKYRIDVSTEIHYRGKLASYVFEKLISVCLIVNLIIFN